MDGCSFSVRLSVLQWWYVHVYISPDPCLALRVCVSRLPGRPTSHHGMLRSKVEGGGICPKGREGV